MDLSATPYLYNVAQVAFGCLLLCCVWPNTFPEEKSMFSMLYEYVRKVFIILTTPLRFIGKRSLSYYIWHGVPISNVVSPFLHRSDTLGRTVAVYFLLLTMISSLTFLYIESKKIIIDPQNGKKMKGKQKIN